MLMHSKGAVDVKGLAKYKSIVPFAKAMARSIARRAVAMVSETVASAVAVAG